MPTMTSNAMTFESLHEAAAVGCPIADARRSAWDRFEAQGLPTRRDEEWRYTNLTGLVDGGFTQGDAHAVDASHIAPYDVAVDAPLMVFVNGHYRADLSRDGGAGIETLSEAIEGDAAPPVHIVADRDEGPIAALNLALFTAGASIRATSPDNSPVHVLHVVSGDAPVLAATRSLVVVDAGCEISIAETHVALGDVEHFILPTTEAIVGEGASLSLCRSIRGSHCFTHLGSLHVQQAADSRVLTHTVTLGGSIVRNEVHAFLEGEGCDSNFDGLYLVGGDQHVDNHLRVEHNAPNCDSREFYKGVLDDDSTAIFTGRIYVKQDAQQTDAKQTNQAILLSDRADVTARPQLEIYADDVKCTHGATIGQVDEQALFYLRARGITRADAWTMLVQAFLGESLDELEDDRFREPLEREIRSRLATTADTR